MYPVDNSGTVVGENPDSYAILALWAVHGLSIVCWVDVQSGHNLSLNEAITVPPCPLSLLLSIGLRIAPQHWAKTGKQLSSLEASYSSQKVGGEGLDLKLNG